MKTPREILLAHHRAAEPKLDAVRRAVVGDKLNNQATKEQRRAPDFVSWFLGCSNTFWRELILPSRRIWSGLAATWIMLLAIHLTQRDPSIATNKSATPAMMSFREQQQILNELLANRTITGFEIDRPKSFSPKPRTEITLFCTV